jgi:hypothetical protein
VSTFRLADLAGSWHHLALTKAGATVTCFLDGEPVASIGGAANTASVAPWHVMNNGAVSEQYTRGRADEIAIYGRPLGEDEVRAHYRLGRPA